MGAAPIRIGFAEGHLQPWQLLLFDRMIYICSLHSILDFVLEFPMHAEFDEVIVVGWLFGTMEEV